MKVGNKILGLAVGQKSILIAEVATKGERHAVNRCAEFVFPEGLTMSAPEKLGAELRSFLRGKQFSTKDVIIGLPAKRLITRRKEVPPATALVAASTLRLQAEGEFSAELDNLVMDFAGTPSTVEATTVLLMATNKVLLDECEALALAAGLRVHAITSTTAALGRATSRLPGGDGWVLNLGPNGAELVVQHGLEPAHLRHLNVTGGSESIPALAAEIRRAMAAIPQNGTPMTLALWNSSTALNPENVLEQRLSMPVTTPEVSSLAVTETADTQGYGPAVALALSALEPAGLAVDFLHSRLAPPKAPAMSMQKKLGIAGGVLLAGIVAYCYVDLNSRQSELAVLNKRTAARQREVDAAKAEIKRVGEARTWLRMDDKRTTGMPTRPALFDALLLDLTKLFPQRPNTIWARDLSCKAGQPYTWQVKGTSVNQTWPDDIQNQMLTGPLADRFQDVHMSFTQEQAVAGQGRGGQQVLWNFVLDFTYVGQGYKPPAPPMVKAAPKVDNP